MYFTHYRKFSTFSRIKADTCKIIFIIHIFYFRDNIEYFFSLCCKVWKFCKSKSIHADTILQHEQIQSVLRRFDENHVWVLPVVDKEKHYLGYISKSRIMTAYREQLVKISQ